MTKADRVNYLDIDVLTMAKRRIKHVYETFDELWVAFSGGKDSLVTLHLVEEVLREQGYAGKINVVFRDEELIPDDVISFVQAYARDPKYNFVYLAVPLLSQKFILGRTCEYIQWDWKRDWLRPKPEMAITDLGAGPNKVYDQYSMDQAVFGRLKGSVAVINGIRADESLIRYSSCVNKRNENYINATDSPKVKFVKPIYDWSVMDIFRYLYDRQIKYCGIYDNQLWNKMKLRVATPLHAEAAKTFGKWRTLYPVFYEQLISIFPEMLAQERYWDDLDRYSIIYAYPRTWDGIFEYIRENIEDRPQRILARDRVQSAKERRERHQRNGTASPENFWGYPLLYVFKIVVAGQYKRVINPSAKPTKEELSYERESIAVAG